MCIKYELSATSLFRVTSAHKTDRQTETATRNAVL